MYRKWNIAQAQPTKPILFTIHQLIWIHFSFIASIEHESKSKIRNASEFRNDYKDQEVNYALSADPYSRIVKIRTMWKVDAWRTT